MESYLRIETALGPSFHVKDPHKIAFVYNGPSQMMLFSSTTSLTTPWPTQLTFASQRCTDCYYAPGGSLFFHTDVNGNENWAIGSVSEANKVQREVIMHTANPGSKHTIQYISSKYLYFTANWTSRNTFDLYRIPLDGLSSINAETATQIYQNPEDGVLLSVGHVLTEDEEDVLLVLRLVYGNASHHLVEISLASGSLYQITRPLVQNSEWRWYAIHYIDRNSLLITTDFNRDLLQFSILQLPSDRLGSALLVDCSLTKAEPSTAGHEVDETYYTPSHPATFFTINDNGYSSLFMAEFKASGEVENLRNLSSRLPAQGVISSGDTRTSRQALSLSSDNTLLAFTFSSPQHPSNIYTLDLNGSDLAKQLTLVQTGGLVAPDAFSNTTLSSFTSSDGLTIPYFRTNPPRWTIKDSSKPLPCIIKVHGGPESQLRPSFSYLTQFMAANGYVMVEPNIRGSTGYGRFYLDADNVEKRLDSIRDLAELVDHLRKSDSTIDPKLIFVFGGSYGGFAALSAVTEYPELWAGAVDLFGISNFETFLEKTAPWRRKLREIEYGSLEHHRDVLRRISPIHRVDRIVAPLFLFQGDTDERVPLGETLQMYERLLSLGKSVTLVRVANEGHGITIRENVLNVYGQVLQFLDNIVNQ